MSPCPGPSAICRGYSRSADLSFQNYPIKIYQQAWRYFFPQLISTIQRVDEGEGPRWRSAWREVNGSADEDAIFRSPDLWTSRYLRERAAASQAAP
ncbi:MAG: hypothetical protein K1X75_10170 [Leptospirales bacterium]|nr:hypothetical protein [Leptospirales bacterium]